MEKIVVTAGDKFTDIDVLACAIAYTELLQLEGKDAVAVLPGVLNKSITKEIKTWNLKYETSCPANPDKFVIIDLSEPDYIAKFVEQDKIIELFDHHFGKEKFWEDKIGKKAKIDKVGACATLIWEEFKTRSNPIKITTTSANLLVAAILSNTLNFKAAVTSQEDIDAFQELQHFTKLPANWTAKYFIDQEEAVFSNPLIEIKNDTHIEKFPNSDETLIIGQIELWDSGKFINNYTQDIKEALESFKVPYWFLTSPSIREGKNYIYAEDSTVQKMLEEKLAVKFSNNLAITNKLLLRKEIKKIIYNY